MKQRALAHLAFPLFLGLVACKAGGPESPYRTLDDNATALRDRFNADVGKTRVVMLVAPT